MFDLEEIARGAYDEGETVLFRDRRSGQRLELNWYSENSPFWAPYLAGGIAKLKETPKFQDRMKQDVWIGRKGHRIAYIQDPDGIFFCLYDHPEEPWEGPIPDRY